MPFGARSSDGIERCLSASSNSADKGIVEMADQGSTQVPRMVRGSVVVQRRRCGKPNCHCADGQALHETTALSYSQAGRTRTLMLDAGQLAAVRRATERYRKARAKLDAEADAGLATLITTRSLARAGR